MATLFETTTIKDLQLSNRVVGSATWLGMADDDGTCTPRLNEVMSKLAQGGVGLIFAGFAYVTKAGKVAPWAMGCHDDRMLPGLAELTQGVHEAGGKVALQIAHAGVMASAELTGETVLGASPMLTEQGPAGRAMTEGEIKETVEAFGAAAVRAVNAGFDGVQIHAAHGYLLSQFLSPFFNQRDDAYGGSVQNRGRMLMQVVRHVQDAVGDAVPVFVKLNTDDRLQGGTSVEEAIEVCAMLQDAGIDAIELSGGTTMALLMNQPENSYAWTGTARLYWRQAAELYKAKIDVPLMLVGGIRSREAAEALVAGGVTDYVSLCRPLIRQPDLVTRWRAGDSTEADCISCNACLMAGVMGQGVHCVHVDA